MRDILKLGLRLLVITLIAALCLAVTESITREPIRLAELSATDASRVAVMKDADVFEPIAWEDLPGMDGQAELLEAHRVLRAGELMGYTMTLSIQGYIGQIPVTVGLLPDGTITQVHIGDIQETAGLGTKIKDAAFLDRFAGLPADQISTDVDTISGATVSSRAVKTAVQEAAAWYHTRIKEGEP